MMNKRITIKDLARYTGFSITTVSLVLNGNANSIPDSVKEKIIQAAKELNYVPNLAARSLARGNSHTIGVIIPDISNSFFAELVHDLQIELNQYGYDIFLCNSDEKMENDIKYINLLSSRAVDGMLLVLSAESMQPQNHALIKETLENIFVPYLFIDRYFENDAHQVIIDNYQGGLDVAKVLYDNGHHNIGLITGPQSLNSSQNRLGGVVDFYASKGIQIPSQNIFIGKYDYDTGYLGAQELLKNKITAIFAFNDLQAYGVLEYCKDHDIKVPQDLSLMGFDNLETSKVVSPKLSTVQQPIDKLSLTAASSIIGMIEGKDVKREVKFGAKLIIRDSVRSLV